MRANVKKRIGILINIVQLLVTMMAYEISYHTIACCGISNCVYYSFVLTPSALRALSRSSIEAPEVAKENMKGFIRRRAEGPEGSTKSVQQFNLFIMSLHFAEGLSPKPPSSRMLVAVAMTTSRREV